MLGLREQDAADVAVPVHCADDAELGISTQQALRSIQFVDELGLHGRPVAGPPRVDLVDLAARAARNLKFHDRFRSSNSVTLSQLREHFGEVFGLAGIGFCDRHFELALQLCLLLVIEVATADVDDPIHELEVNDFTFWQICRFVQQETPIPDVSLERLHRVSLPPATST
jgi:hypothetical protein